MVEPDRALTLEEWKELFQLRWYWRVPIGIAGVVLLCTAYGLHESPPSRVLWELFPGNKLSDKVTVSVADSPSIVIAMFAAGCAFIIWAIIGIKIFRFEGFGITAQLPPPPGPNADTAQKPVAPTPAPAPARAPAAAASGMPFEPQVGNDTVHTFLLRSSWNGLKILKACQVAQKKGKAIQLKIICKIPAEMSYDYAFGYFIASFSADAFHGVADPSSGVAHVFTVHPTLEALLDEIIQGNIKVVPQMAAQKQTELAMLNAYLAQL